MARSRILVFVSTTIVTLLIGGSAGATPVAKTKEERATYGRTFLEPAASTNYIQYGEGGHGEFEYGFELLEKIYPRYLKFTTVDKELNDPNAVSVGADRIPAWSNDDTGDGLPLHVAIATDESVPDKNKQYVVLTAGHSGEPCGREGGARFIEDLLIAAKETPDKVFDNAQGVSGKTFEMTAPEILKRTKIFFLSPSPDGWLVGDGYAESHSQYNGAGVNSNRLAYTDGWSFPRDSTLYLRGYTTYTQPEGIAMTHYLRQIREKELNGRPFAVAMDLHGPLPFGFILLHDEGNDPLKLERMVDLGTRVKQNMEETVPAFGPLDAGLDLGLHSLRDGLPDSRDLGTLDNDAWRLQGWGRWGFVTHIVDSLGYTASGSWGGFFASNSGLDAVSLSYEINCRPSSPWLPADEQVYANNVRNVMETGVVTAASWSKIPQFQVKMPKNVGFYEPGLRVTDADGNPSPVPRLSNPIAGKLRQGHYDVANTDYFRDLKKVTKNPPREVTPRAVPQALKTLKRFVVADATVAQTGALRRFVKGGGDLILTDSALKMLPKVSGIPEKKVHRDYAYVGYADLDRSQPMTKGLLATAWQTFSPTPIGFPLLMERDSYWESGTNNEDAGESSPTKNSAPIWSVDRDAWEAAGGVTIGTTDPPADRKSVDEGNNFDGVGKRDADQDKTEIGTLKVGKGRIVIFGALLPRPTEKYPHWFGLNGYSVSAAGQTMFLRAMSGQV
jgi:hypothetical protein